MESVQFTVRWDEVDLNGHLRHTGYGAMCAEARVRTFAAAGMGIDRDSIATAAPILLREELVYRKEVMLGEEVTVTSAISEDPESAGKRWIIEHEVIKATGEVACKVTVLGAWINLDTRKLTMPPSEIIQTLMAKNP